MPTTLLVEKSDQLQSFYEINLLTWVGSSIVCCSSTEMAISELKNSEQYDLIICRYQIEQAETARELINFLQMSNVDIPLIVVGGEVKDFDVINIKSALDIKDLIQNSAKLMNVTAKDMAALSVPEYFAIPIQAFNSLSYSPCEIYWRATEEDEFELLFEAKKQFSPDKLKEMIASGIMELSVKRAERLRFVSFLTSQIVSELEIKDLNKNEQVKAMEMSNNLLTEKFAVLGICGETIELANKNLKDMVKTSKKVPALMRLMKRMLDNKSGFKFKHTQILLFVAGHIMEHMDWGNEEQKDKIQFIAFFHDIVLENDEQAKIHSEEELKASGLPEKKQELVRKHAQLASQLVCQYPKAPMGAEQIIKQHHGVNHGVGFAKNYTANLSPMTIVFILAEDFAKAVIEEAADFDLKKTIYLMRKKYATKRFEKIIDILQEVSLT